MASRGRGARAKGFQFERDIAKELSDATGFEFKRGLGQTRGGGGEVPDVVPPPFIGELVHIECKRQKSCSVKGAMKQADEDIAKRIASAEVSITPVPIAITKDDRKDTIVTMKLNDFLPLFKAWVTQLEQ